MEKSHPPEGTVFADPSRRRQEAETRIRSLNALSRRGIWGILLFLLISLGAVLEFSFLPPLPDSIQRVLGPAPPVRLISIALVVYSFSALILILSRMWSGTGAYKGWSHLGYLTAFYGFYGYGNALGQNFPAVFVAGLTILGLEWYHNFTHCREVLVQEMENIARLDRLEEFNRPD